jgi:hypothetical protein
MCERKDLIVAICSVLYLRVIGSGDTVEIQVGGSLLCHLHITGYFPFDIVHLLL